MEPQEGICGLCLKVCDNFKTIERDMKDVLDVVLPKIDLVAMHEVVMCTDCREMFIKCFDFKTACFCTYNYIVPFVDNKNKGTLNLKEVYLIKNKNSTCVPEDQCICGFCMVPVENSSAISVDVEERDAVLETMMEQCLPELDLSIIEKPVICAPCHVSLGNCFRFVTNCLTAQKKIKKYRETLDLNKSHQIELSSLLEFTMRDVTSDPDDHSINIIKVEEQLCDDSENAKDKIDHKNKSFMNMDLKFNSEQEFSSNNVLIYKEESNNLDVNKIYDTFCGENESDLKEGNLVKMKDTNFLVKEEIKINTDEQDLHRFEIDVLPRLEVAPIIHRKQESLKANLEEDLLKPTYTKEISTTKNAGKVLYQCAHCSFETIFIESMREHLLNEEGEMYKCGSCSFQSRNKMSLKTHLLVHKDPLEIPMHKCMFCSFQTKHKHSMQTHSLVHKSPSEVTMYNCDICLYRTKHKSGLKQHLLTHKDPSEVTMYKCDFCSFQTRFKKILKQHSLIHKSPSEVRMYKCVFCSFQTKYKHSMQIHSLVHKSPSEVTMYKCDVCPYQTNRKGHLKRHSLGHEVTIYKCNVCLYQTKRKGHLKRHSVRHENLY